MKFVIAVVMLVLAASAQSSVLPLGLLGGVGAPWGGLGIHGPAAVAVHAAAPWGLTAPGAWGVPGISLAQGLGPLAAPIALGHGIGHGIGHEGVYVAKTRGAIHTAPLAGHISSATSVNVAPAPGTI